MPRVVISHLSADGCVASCPARHYPTLEAWEHDLKDPEVYGPGDLALLTSPEVDQATLEATYRERFGFPPLGETRVKRT